MAVLLVAAACSSGTSRSPASTSTSTVPTSSPSSTTTPAAKGTLDSIELTTVKVADLDNPTAMAARPSSPDLYIAERGGVVRLVKVIKPTTATGSPRYQVQTTPVLDISKEVLAGGEQGLLGMAFSSDGRKLYVDYTAKPDGRTRIVEYTLGDRTSADVSTRRPLLTIKQPAPNHNGGGLTIGPDGYLYIGMGDGGGSGDPQGNGQDRKALLGKILRIDPEGSTSTRPYGIPAGNPWADGKDGAPEAWLYGVRNPWRFSFDALTGDLWVGDVGQGKWEEIDRLPADGGFDAGRAANLGWNRMEGSHAFAGNNPEGGVLPIAEYSHKDGCSVIGGYVYRGSAIDALQGTYLYTDYCQSGIRGLQMDKGTIIDRRTWSLGTTSVFSFGQDNDGELYVLQEAGAVVKITAPTATKSSTTTASSRRAVITTTTTPTAP